MHKSLQWHWFSKSPNWFILACAWSISPRRSIGWEWYYGIQIRHSTTKGQNLFSVQSKTQTCANLLKQIGWLNLTFEVIEWEWTPWDANRTGHLAASLTMHHLPLVRLQWFRFALILFLEYNGIGSFYVFGFWVLKKDAWWKQKGIRQGERGNEKRVS